MVSAQADVIAPIAIETSATQTMTDQKMPGGCDHCDDQDMAMTAMPCFALGACVHGIIPDATGFFAEDKVAVYSLYVEHISGIQGAPDPFPPRSEILA